MQLIINIFKKKQRIIFTSLGVFICGYLLFKHDAAMTIENVSPRALFLLVVLKTVVAFVNAVKFRFSANIFHLNLSFLEWNGLPYITTFHNYIMPINTGNLFRATYLKIRHNFSYSKFIGLLIGSNCIDIIVTCILGFIAAFFLKTIIEKAALIFFPIFILSLASIIALILTCHLLFGKLTENKKSRFVKLISNLQTSISVFKDAPLSIIQFGFISIISILFRSISLLFCFYILGINPSLALVIVSICLTNFTILFSLTPGNLGVTEGTLAATFFMAGIPMDIGLEVTALSRLTSMLVQAALGLFFSYILSGKLRTMETKKE